MRQADVAAAIRARFEAQWTIPESEMPRVWPNTLTVLPPPPFIAIEIQFGAPQIVSLGGYGTNTQRQSGEVIMRLFEQSVYGDERIRAYADQAADVFRLWISGELRFYAAATESEIDMTGNVFELDVLAHFEFDITPPRTT